MKVIERLALAVSLVFISNYSTTASVIKSVKPVYVADQVKCAKQNYNHYAYKEVPRNLLEPVGNGQKLHRDAATAFKQMRQAAKKRWNYFDAYIWISFDTTTALFIP